ncbi:nucleobase-ascorbate transporter 12-like isoform X1 [Phoenix dactylifera]|uniref:Nucleobase-ascorbate transporter 12-like isoform X1 n=1 Tax=Phoenix dactylifera TaxID=42345 RepID=A0A8B9A5X9_PHODC|nr:nucleobase-ascorbate transporter 12-like isoform X1 [Phoenix dactylifera]
MNRPSSGGGVAPAATQPQEPHRLLRRHHRHHPGRPHQDGALRRHRPQDRRELQAVLHRRIQETWGRHRGAYVQWEIELLGFEMPKVLLTEEISGSLRKLKVGSYHASSLLVASRPPTAGVLSRGIGMEGVSSVLAGVWGTGVGSTTLTENVHTIAVTKMGSRRAVELGAVILILLSFVGKVGGFIASIPDVMVAALLCFMWAMLAALGLSNLRYSETGSSRNNIIVGLSLFFSLSIPAYFQQYGLVPNANSSVPSYFQPYIVASHGPFRTGFGGEIVI